MWRSDSRGYLFSEHFQWPKLLADVYWDLNRPQFRPTPGFDPFEIVDNRYHYHVDSNPFKWLREGDELGKYADARSLHELKYIRHRIRYERSMPRINYTRLSIE